MRKHLAQTQKKSSQERLILVSNLLSLPSPPSQLSPHHLHNVNNNINNTANNNNTNNNTSINNINKNNNDVNNNKTINKNEANENQNKKNEMQEKIEKGRFQITNKRIGEGANGDVFLAFDPITNQEIALKIVTFHEFAQKKLFEKEVNFSFQMSGQENVLNYISSHSFSISTKKKEEKNNLNDQSINEFYYSIDEIKDLIERGMIEIDLNDDENLFFDQKEEEKEEMEFGVIAMEKMSVDLIDYRINNHLTNDQVRKIFYSICKSIEQCHSNLVFHLDLKPDNVLLLFSNNNNYDNDNDNNDNNDNNIDQMNDINNNRSFDEIKGVKLADFGWATNEKRILKLKDYPRFGTRMYLPPECFPIGENSSNKIIYADKVDIWGLGVTLFVLLTGQFPYIQNKSGEFIKNKVKIGDDLPDDLVHLLLDFNFHRRPDIFTVMKHPYISLSSHPYTPLSSSHLTSSSLSSSFHFNSFSDNNSFDDVNNENNIKNNIKNSQNNNANLNKIKNKSEEFDRENKCKKLNLFAKIKRQMKKII